MSVEQDRDDAARDGDTAGDAAGTGPGARDADHAGARDAEHAEHAGAPGDAAAGPVVSPEALEEYEYLAEHADTESGRTFWRRTADSVRAALARRPAGDRPGRPASRLVAVPGDAEVDLAVTDRLLDLVDGPSRQAAQLVADQN
jgi:hypothetical protein